MNPTYGSKPTASRADVHIDSNKAYAKDSIAFNSSLGGLLLLDTNLKSSFCCRINSLKTPKYWTAVFPSIPLSESMLSISFSSSFIDTSIKLDTDFNLSISTRNG